MSTKFYTEGDRDLPLLTCIHGLMGGPEDFRNMLEPWQGKFCLVLVDMNAEFREDGLLKTTREGFGRKSYDDAALDVIDYFKSEFPGRKSHFVGVSIGGKVVYDIIDKAPELFLSGVISDVGPGQIPESDLYNFVEVTIPSINLNLEWAELKEDIASKIPDRHTRVMIQTQVYYPNGSAPASWKPGMGGLRGMLTGARIKEQWYVLEKIKSKLIILRAAHLSGIPDKDIARIATNPNIEIRVVGTASHFIHVSARGEFQTAVLSLLN